MLPEVPPDAASPRRDPSKGPAGAADALVRAVERALEERGIGAAVGLLNARTRFRYTGVYRAEPPDLRNICLYDRENPALNMSGIVHPIESTYCSIVCATGEPFETPDAPRDPRLAGHPALETVLSYVGVPLRRPSGVPWGVLCHWDPRPRLLPPHEADVLTRVAPILARWAIAQADAAGA
jgi:hypothetical protein